MDKKAAERKAALEAGRKKLDAFRASKKTGKQPGQAASCVVAASAPPAGHNGPAANGAAAAFESRRDPPGPLAQLANADATAAPGVPTAPLQRPLASTPHATLDALRAPGLAPNQAPSRAEDHSHAPPVVGDGSTGTTSERVVAQQHAAAGLGSEHLRSAQPGFGAGRFEGSSYQPLPSAPPPPAFQGGIPAAVAPAPSDEPSVAAASAEGEQTIGAEGDAAPWWQQSQPGSGLQGTPTRPHPGQVVDAPLPVAAKGGLDSGAAGSFTPDMSTLSTHAPLATQPPSVAAPSLFSAQHTVPPRSGFHGGGFAAAPDAAAASSLRGDAPPFSSPQRSDADAPGPAGSAPPFRANGELHAAKPHEPAPALSPAKASLSGGGPTPPLGTTFGQHVGGAGVAANGRGRISDRMPSTDQGVAAPSALAEALSAEPAALPGQPAQLLQHAAPAAEGGLAPPPPPFLRPAKPADAPAAAPFARFALPPGAARLLQPPPAAAAAAAPPSGRIEGEAGAEPLNGGPPNVTPRLGAEPDSEPSSLSGGDPQTSTSDPSRHDESAGPPSGDGSGGSPSHSRAKRLRAAAAAAAATPAARWFMSKAVGAYSFLAGPDGASQAAADAGDMPPGGGDAVGGPPTAQSTFDGSADGSAPTSTGAGGGEASGPSSGADAKRFARAWAPAPLQMNGLGESAAHAVPALEVSPPAAGTTDPDEHTPGPAAAAPQPAVVPSMLPIRGNADFDTAPSAATSTPPPAATLQPPVLTTAAAKHDTTSDDVDASLRGGYGGARPVASTPSSNPADSVYGSIHGILRSAGVSSAGAGLSLAASFAGEALHGSPKDSPRMRAAWPGAVDAPSSAASGTPADRAIASFSSPMTRVSEFELENGRGARADGDSNGALSAASVGDAVAPKTGAASPLTAADAPRPVTAPPAVLRQAKAPPPPAFLFQPAAPVAAPDYGFTDTFAGASTAAVNGLDFSARGLVASSSAASLREDDVAAASGLAVGAFEGKGLGQGGGAAPSSRAESGWDDVGKPPAAHRDGENGFRSRFAPGPPAPDRAAPSFADSLTPSVNEKSKALQSYIADLEAQKFELQRGLQKQMAVVAQLSESQSEADATVAALKADKARLQEELDAHQQALAQQAAEAAAAREAFDSAERAVHEAMERAQTLAAENVALEEALAAEKSAALAAAQGSTEWESRLAVERRNTAAAHERAAKLAEKHEQERRRLLERITELQADKTKLFGRLKEIAIKKAVTGADVTRLQHLESLDAAGPPTGIDADAQTDPDPPPPATTAAGTQTTSAPPRFGERRKSTQHASDPLADDFGVADGIDEAEVPAAELPAALQALPPRRRALLPTLKWAGGASPQAAAIADTQLAVLTNIHDLISSLEATHAGLRAELAAARAALADAEGARAALAAENARLTGGASPAPQQPAQAAAAGAAAGGAPDAATAAPPAAADALHDHLGPSDRPERDGEPPRTPWDDSADRHAAAGVAAQQQPGGDGSAWTLTQSSASEDAALRAARQDRSDGDRPPSGLLYSPMQTPEPPAFAMRPGRLAVDFSSPALITSSRETPFDTPSGVIIRPPSLETDGESVADDSGHGRDDSVTLSEAISQAAPARRGWLMGLFGRTTPRQQAPLRNLLTAA